MRKLILLICIIFSVVPVLSQELLKQDLKTIKVDQLSDNEITAYYNKLQQSGISTEQAEQIAAAKGLPAEEIAKLRKRVEALLLNTKPAIPTKNNFPDTVVSARKQDSDNALLKQEQASLQVFGSQLFNTSSLSFEPNLRIATPANYQLGPDDELLVDVYGYSEAHYKLKVSPEGNVYIANAGPVWVSGLTIEQASLKIKKKLAATIYKAIDNGNTNIQVSLGNIRSIRVTIIGEAKKPGTYTVSSLSTVFNALYACGGPGDNGSYRTIELLRGNKLVKKIDLYNFLLAGNREADIRLNDQDIIRIPFYKNRVSLKGEIKRPSVYELLAGDHLQQLIEDAGGFTDSAYTSSVKIKRVTDKERKVVDVDNKDFTVYTLQGSDEVIVGKILDRYSNRVKLNGAIMRPGEFELTNGLTLKQLIGKADGLREDAFKERGIITRLKDDLTVEVISFDAGKIVSGVQEDIALMREDVVNISSIFELRNKATLTVQGEVRVPGNYPYKDSISLKDLLLEAGGFTESAMGKRIEIARRVTNGDNTAVSTEVARIIQVDTEKDMLPDGVPVYLQPYDVVIIHNNPGYFIQKTVVVDGEVLYPGPYVIRSSDEKISNLIARAGGFRSTADAASASLRRANNNTIITDIKNQNINKVATDKKIQVSGDSLKVEAEKPYDLIGINLEEIMKQPGITNDLILENGDLLFIPKKNQAVKVRGEVLFPTQFAFEQDKDLKYYIDKAGGFSSNALRKKAFVLGANGNARKVKHFLFFKSYPSINAGDEIYVPAKPQASKALSTAEVVGITSAVISLASVIILLINNIK